MPNPSQHGKDQQTAADGARLIPLREKFRQLNPAFDKSRITPVVFPDGSRRDPRGPEADATQPLELSRQAEFDGDATSTGQPAQELMREPSLSVGLLRCAGAIIGFMTGGPGGAAVGAMLAVVAGALIVQRSMLFWLKLKSIAVRRTERGS